MSNANVWNKINESRRDALVNYSISNDIFDKDEIKNADNLYQHLLLDTKISSAVKTSKVAEAISSLQLYIERCIDGAEPEAAADKVAKHFSTDNFLHDWSIYNKRYARWAGKEKLQYYAADYIDPTLRYNKTELFTEFEQSINQTKLTEASVTKAMDNYLNNYEKLARLDTISHLVVPNSNKHFFIARTQEVPYQYYWRSCEENSADNYIWSEWLKVNCNIDGLHKDHISLFWQRNRLFISWESSEIRKTAENKEITFHYLNVSYKNSDNSWINNSKYDISNNKVKFDVNKLERIKDHFSYEDPVAGEFYKINKITIPTGLSAEGHITLIYNKINTSVYQPVTLRSTSVAAEHVKITKINIHFENNEVIVFDNKIIENHIIPNKSKPLYISFDWEISERNKNPDGSNIIITDQPTKLTIADPLQLISNLQVSIDKLLNYNEQIDHISSKDFNQSYGIYLWELFFHIPLLASVRFLTEQRFDEAERWLKFLFNSAGYRDASGKLQLDEENVRYWNMLPLQKDSDWDGTIALATTDPDIIAMKDPMQYKLAVFMRTLDVLIARGDQAYRQLERDTLVDAKMYYIQASQLLGPRPEIQLAHDWKNQNLKDTTDSNFLPPYNEVLLAYWDKLETRLYNLRHNLSLDGQPLHLPLFAAPVDPKELQRQHSAGNGIGSALNPIAAATSLYRFPVLLERAKGAVSSVMQFGNALQNALERQDSEAMALLLQQQQQQVLKQTRDIQNANIGILQSSREATTVMKSGAEERLEYYGKLISGDISNYEQKGLEMRIASQMLGLTAIIPIAVGAAVDTAPNIFGMADGGSHWGAIAQSTGWGIQIAAGSIEQGAGIQEVKANFARRAEEWQLQHTLAEKDVAQLQEQLTGLDLQISMAQKQRDLAEMEQSHALAVYQMQTTRFSGKELYNWMVGRLSGLYYQLFDAAQPLCLMAKSGLERDIDASKTQHLFISSGWNDLYQGLLAGEDLMLNLQKLENIWLIEDQRALEVERSISLAGLYDASSAHFNLAEKISEYISQKTTEEQTAEGGTTVSIKDNILSVSVKITELALDTDYPQAMSLGKKRRIKQISVSLPALLGPYQDVQATLSYDGDYKQLANGCTAIAISRGMNDSGQFQLDFNDGKYLPFEGIDISDTGALVLRFPNATGKQQALLQSLSDIILHVRYTIRS
ncbi:neuraminidase-like domain-containing protein [Yersinia thracica]|uniref:Tc toxin subunit A-related protein n=1 Tax=Yersinia thracica TaxID=2890319 RepID=UPI001643E912|nr:neuraminidase-like domain-containing protein [Yersinia thracica]